MFSESNYVTWFKMLDSEKKKWTENEYSGHESA